MYSWSYSSLKEFVNCPRKYHEVKVLKKYPLKRTKEIIYGEEVHRACEEYVRDDKPLPTNYSEFKPSLDVIKQIPGERFTEHRMALTKDRHPCSWGAKDVWVRGIADLMIKDGDKLSIIDYKTGNDKYPDARQLKLMAAMSFIHFPDVMEIKAALIFITRNNIVHEKYHYTNLDALWDSMSSDLARLDAAYENNVWNESPSPLCGWCPVKDCQHNRG